MDRKLRVLLLVTEPWRHDDGGGNTLNNFFEGMDAEFAQVYSSEKMPINTVCERYFQITDVEAVKSFLTKKPVGRVLSKEDIHSLENGSNAENVKRKKTPFALVKRLRWETFLFLKEFAWLHCNWKTERLKNFILDFNPDVIYAPCYASPYSLALTRWVKDLTGKKVVTWSADDTYSLRQFRFSPIYWMKRFWTRKHLRKTYPYYDAFYSISEDEAEEMRDVVGQEIKILRKTVPDDLDYKERMPHTPIRMIYAGGIYLNRWKVLAKIGQALKNINKNGVKCVLDIYTQNELSKKQKKLLNDGENIFVHKAVTTEELQKMYTESDIALHVESFSRKNRLETRLSFSTKIIDCLASGCAVMAIAWEEQTGLKYLKKNDAAICITNQNKIEEKLNAIFEQPSIVSEYALKAYNLSIKNHKKGIVQNELYETLLANAKKDKL